MRAGRVKISPSYLHGVLRFKPDWVIDKIKYSQDDDFIEMTILGFDFPELAPSGRAKKCELIGHRESFKWEVNE